MGGCLRVREYRNARIRGDFSRFNWEQDDCPDLRTLRERYDLDGVVASARTQFDRVLRLMGWAHRRWRHDPANRAPRQDALSLLAGAERGEQYRCVEYANLLVQLCTAFGWPARAVRLVQPYPGGPVRGQAHFVTEVWIDDLGKWVCFDAQTDSYWEYRGEPLGVLELQDLVATGHWFGLRWRRRSAMNLRKYMERQLEDRGLPARWAPLALGLYTLVRARSDFAAFFLHPRFYFANNYMTSQGPWPPPLEYVHPRTVPQLFYNGSYDAVYHTTADRSLIDFTCNLVDLDLEPPGPDDPQDRLRVTVRHCVPWLDHFEANWQGTWTRITTPFDWRLQPGYNRLEVRAVSRFGNVTPPAVIGIEVPQ